MREHSRGDRLYVLLKGSASIWVGELRDREYNDKDGERLEQEEESVAHSATAASHPDVFRKTIRTRFITIVHSANGCTAFGELALVNDMLRTATVVSEGQCDIRQSYVYKALSDDDDEQPAPAEFLTIDKEDFDRVIKQREKSKFQQRIQALKTLKGRVYSTMPTFIPCGPWLQADGS